MTTLLQKIPKNWLILVALISMLSWGSNPKKHIRNTPPTTDKKPKNIILLIGDGMGISQVSSIYFDSIYKPNFSRFQTIGLIKTSSSSDLITDSAAAATSFASGEKTYNGAIGVDTNKKPIETIAEWASKRNMKTGLISTSSLTHATPASFYAHVENRGMQYKIANYMPQSGIDFFAGGGSQFFFNRRDGSSLYGELNDQGYVMDTISLGNLKKLDQGKKYGFLLAKDAMKPANEDRGPFLKDASLMALEYLSKNQNGFFLMIEGSQIDWGGHANNAEYVKAETLDFDETIGAVLDFAAKDGNTLVIVTADHETGGYTLAPNGSNYNEIEPVFATTGHSATLIPVFAFGPGENEFSGIYENTEIYHKMKKLLE